MRQHRVLFFDLDHTLVDTRRQYQEALALTVSRLYGDGLPGDFIERFLHHHEALWPLYDDRVLTMDELRRERFLRAWRDYGVERSTAEADAFQAAYDAVFDETVHAFPGTAFMLETLRDEWSFGIITNGAPDLQWRKLRAAGLDAFFAEEAVIVSERVGRAKPHAEVFLAACEALRVQPAAAVMIGDNWDADICGARGVGMTALWYVPDRAAVVPEVGETPLRTPAEVVHAVRTLERQ